MDFHEFDPKNLQKLDLGLSEIPSLQINKLNQELDELESELKDLEKLEIQTQYEPISQSTQQLQEVNYLR